MRIASIRLQPMNVSASAIIRSIKMRKIVKTRTGKLKKWKLGRVALLVKNGIITSIVALPKH